MTYVPPIPDTYNSSTISVDVEQLAACQVAISKAVQDIATNLSNINKTLNGLALNWLGDASNQAGTYNDAWNKVVQELYGAMDADGNQTVNDGALSVLTSGLDQAVTNYRANEQAVTALFNGFGANGSNSNPTQSVTDSATVPISDATGIREYLYHTTAVNEAF